jgi:hypothetical protein
MTDQTNIELTITDLARLKVIVDTACERGAFRANEMKNIGETYDRLVAFLSAVVAQGEQAQPPKGESE